MPYKTVDGTTKKLVRGSVTIALGSMPFSEALKKAEELIDKFYKRKVLELRADYFIPVRIQETKAIYAMYASEMSPTATTTEAMVVFADMNPICPKDEKDWKMLFEEMMQELGDGFKQSELYVVYTDIDVMAYKRV